MTAFKWLKKQREAAMLLAEGYTILEVSARINKSESQIYRWKRNLEFVTEVDRLSNMIMIASRAERLRITHRVVRKLMEKDLPTQKDLLEWLKFGQSETDGIRLDLTALLDVETSVASGGSE